LVIRHLKQINLWHRAGNVQQGIDPAEAVQRFVDEVFGTSGLA
jgi:hypothetical protein